jgi:hypothetical protein
MRTLMMSAIALMVMAPAQKPTIDTVAAKLTGTWKLNRELSPGVSTPRGAGGGRGRGAQFAVGTFAPQRGGGRGAATDTYTPTAQDLTPEEIAADQALQQLQRVADTMTIKASAESVTFADPRGERVFAIHDKTDRLELEGAMLSVKSRWDKLTLRQEFWNPRRKLVETWGPDEAGRLVLKVHVESMTFNTPDVKAVFDRQ